MAFVKQGTYKSATLNFQAGNIDFDESGIAEVNDDQLENLQNFFGSSLTIADEDGNFPELVVDKTPSTSTQSQKTKPIRTPESVASNYKFKSVQWLKDKILEQGIATAEEADLLEKDDLIKVLVEFEFPAVETEIESIVEQKVDVIEAVQEVKTSEAVQEVKTSKKNK